MPENEFEKQIQDRLDSLNLEPSAAVWQQVEFRIRKDKRRRWFIWIPLLAAGIGAGIWLSTGHDKTDLAIQAKPKINATTAASTPAKSSDQTSTASNTNTRRREMDETAKKGNGGEPVQPERIQTSTSSIVYTQSNRSHKSKVHKSRSNTEENKSTSTKSSAGEADTQAAESATAIANNGNAATENNVSAVDSSNLVKKQPETAPAKTDEKKAASMPKKKAGRVWSFGLQAGSGISAQSHGVFAASQSYANDLYAGNTGSLAMAPVYHKAPLKNAFAFSIGGYAERRLSKALSLEVGLMYSQYGSNIEAGNNVNNTAFITLGSARYMTVSNYYQSQSNSSSSTYHNRYHYLEMPVKLNIRLNPSGKTAFRWELGLSPAYMVAANALHYDEQQNIFYHDNAYFNKWQLGFSTAIAIRAFGKSKHPVWIGPEYRSFLTNLTNQNNTNGNHLYYGGIKAAFKLR